MRSSSFGADGAFDDVEYKGDEPGLCPMCHLNVIVLRGRQVECATCGARGELVVEGGDASVRFPEEGCRSSVISLHEKHEHFLEIQETAARHRERQAEIDARASAYDTFGARLAPPPRPG